MIPRSGWWPRRSAEYGDAASELYEAAARNHLTSTATWAHFKLCGECLADDASRSIALVTLSAAAWLSQAVCVERFFSPCSRASATPR